MLEVNALTKTYENQQGIRDISFKAKNGEIIAFVGPNGAGKTTLFRILAGVVDNYSGNCVLNGCDITNPEKRRKIGWLDETPFAFPEMTPIQFAFYLREMKELAVDDAEINNLLETFELYKYRNQKIKAFSQGMYKKAAMLPVLMGQPELLILDEPTNGLDTNAIISLKQLLLQAKERGAIILLSSHILDFVGKIADTVLFLKEGSICIEKSNIEMDLEDIYQQLYPFSKVSQICDKHNKMLGN